MLARMMPLLTELGNSFALVLQRCRPNGAERQSAGNFFSSALRWVKVSPDTVRLRRTSKRLSIVRTDPFTTRSVRRVQRFGSCDQHLETTPCNSYRPPFRP